MMKESTVTTPPDAEGLFPVDPSTSVTLRTGVRVRVPGGLRVPADFPYVPTRDHVLLKCQAAWSTFDGDGRPLSFRLAGPPGVGKNAAVYALAAERDQPLYIVQGHEELTAEDLVATGALRDDGAIEYVASPLLAAMLTGGICFIDEISKMRPKALAPLASVLDERRTVFSALLGESFIAAPEFRFCAALNPTDADAYDLEGWLRRRTRPVIHVRRPDWSTLETILARRDPDAAALSETIQRRARDRDLHLDPGTVLRLAAYARRLEWLAEDRDVDIGDAINVAFEHFSDAGLEDPDDE